MNENEEIKFEGSGKGSSGAESYNVVIDETQKRFDTLKEEISEFKDKIIEILAIFVALFTFVSVDIQIFKTDVTFYTVIGFSLIMLGALLLFVLMIYFFIDKNYNQNKIKTILGIIFMIGLIGIGVVISNNEHNQYTKKIYEINNNIMLTDKNFTDFKMCLKSGGWGKCF